VSTGGLGGVSSAPCVSAGTAPRGYADGLSKGFVVSWTC
jgi:hypothetical protein